MVSNWRALRLERTLRDVGPCEGAVHEEEVQELLERHGDERVLPHADEARLAHAFAQLWLGNAEQLRRRDPHRVACHAHHAPSSTLSLAHWGKEY